MADLLSGGVMRGLVGASGAMKSADTAMYVYVQKKAQGDEEGMRRALGYATDHMSVANEATEDSKTALTENIQAAREQEQVEQAERLEKARQEVADEKAEIQADADDVNQKITAPVDTVEISPEAVAALENEQSVAAVQTNDIAGVNQRQFEQHMEKPVETKSMKSNTPYIKSDVVGSANKNHRKLNVKV